MSIRVRYLFFDMNSYFASVAQNEEPALRGCPVGVLTTDAPNAACIAVSYEAKARGVRMGLRQHEARALCPEIVFRPAKHDVYVNYHHRIRKAVDQVIPIAQAHSVDEFSCRLMGQQERLETALELACQVQEVLLAKVGPAMRASVGLAPSVTLAKLAAELKKPLGINWLHPSVLPQKIADLPLGDIPGVSKGMLARLERAGVTDVPSLLALSPKQARAIWRNVVGEKVLRALWGEEVSWDTQSGKTIGHSQHLTGKNRTPEGARLVARRLIVKAGARLRRQGQVARCLHLSARCYQTGRQGAQRDLLPTQDTFTLLQAFEALWPRVTLTTPKSVGVTLSGLSLFDDQIQDLFEPRNSEAPTSREALCHALDGLNRRFGQDTIRFGELPRHRVPYTGAKIAFNRVPDLLDFDE